MGGLKLEMADNAKIIAKIVSRITHPGRAGQLTGPAAGRDGEDAGRIQELVSS